MEECYLGVREREARCEICHFLGVHRVIRPYTMWHVGYIVLIRRSVYMSVLLYLHLKNDVFPISLPFPLYHLFLPIVVTSLVDFLTACKRLRRLCILSGTSDSKNPKLSICPRLIRRTRMEKVHFVICQ